MTAFVARSSPLAEGTKAWQAFFLLFENFLSQKNGFFSASDYTIALRSVDSGRQIFASFVRAQLAFAIPTPPECHLPVEPKRQARTERPRKPPYTRNTDEVSKSKRAL
jgi:hypothetical protein